MGTEMTRENIEETAVDLNAVSNEEPAAAEPAEKTAQKSSGKSAKKSGSFGRIFGGGKKSSKSRPDSGSNSEDDIKKLTRTELLELLIDETKEADRLRAENDRLREELERCHADLDRIASFEAVIARLESIVNGR